MQDFRRRRRRGIKGIPCARLSRPRRWYQKPAHPNCYPTPRFRFIEIDAGSAIRERAPPGCFFSRSLVFAWLKSTPAAIIPDGCCRAKRIAGCNARWERRPPRTSASRGPGCPGNGARRRRGLGVPESIHLSRRGAVPTRRGRRSDERCRPPWCRMRVEPGRPASGGLRRNSAMSGSRKNGLWAVRRPVPPGPLDIHGPARIHPVHSSTRISDTGLRTPTGTSSGYPYQNIPTTSSTTGSTQIRS